MTRVLTLMFHRVNDASLGYQPQQFARYLDYLVNHFPIVVPGEALPQVPLAICLTFDDAYYDFYHNVYPLLLEYKIKAILAVPAKYIIDNTQLDSDTRLSVPYAHNMEDPSHQAKVPFCTWDELRQMAQSQHVLIASHGYQHANLADKATDLSQEIITSKQILEKQLSLPINYFVYPFGKMNSKVHQKICQHYAYGIRIGSALNKGWDEKRRYVYRINADPLWTTHTPIQAQLLKKLTFKYWLNRLRFK